MMRSFVDIDVLCMVVFVCMLIMFVGDGWWWMVVIYQVYVCSFVDGNGDGIGDFVGVCLRFLYLKSFGVDVFWFILWYLSFFVDGGYDVQDYCCIDFCFGFLEEVEQLIVEVFVLGI